MRGAWIVSGMLLLLGLGAACAAPPEPAPVPADPAAFLDQLEQRTFRWFVDTADPKTGLTPDRAPTKSFSSVAAVGFGLTALPIGVERGWIPRAEAAARAARVLDTLWNGKQGDGALGMTGYKGFFYHFLDMRTAERYDRNVELSTIDTALAVAGALACAQYFDRADPVEARVRDLADRIYRRVDWAWAVHEIKDRPPLVRHGWTPEHGFLPYDWGGYNEAMILYVLALGSPTHPVPPETWAGFTATYAWGEAIEGQPYVAFEPLFGHQYSHAWIDFRGIRDAFMRAHGIDYFENSRRATRAQRAYGIANPNGFRGYDEFTWGLTACDGPGDMVLTLDGKQRAFHGYMARGMSFRAAHDDGTIAPTAVAGSVPFAPEITIPALAEMARRYGADLYGEHGFVDAFNPTFDRKTGGARVGRVVPGKGWFDTDRLGIDQGPIVVMIENHRTGLVWNLVKKNASVVQGLRRAGFTGGWLDGAN